MQEKHLILVRGLPGSGKSTFAKLLKGAYHLETDMFFINPQTNEYKFEVSRLKEAHAWCQRQAERCMGVGIENLIISNTFTEEWEMDSYIKSAKKYGYQVHIIIKENRHEGGSIHNVPQETIEKMHDRFEIKLL